MSSTRIYSNECKFCARYLKDNGVSGDNFDELVALITELDPDYKLIKIEKEDFFKSLATSTATQSGFPYFLINSFTTNRN